MPSVASVVVRSVEALLHPVPLRALVVAACAGVLPASAEAPAAQAGPGVRILLQFLTPEFRLDPAGSGQVARAEGCVPGRVAGAPDLGTLVELLRAPPGVRVTMTTGTCVFVAQESVYISPVERTRRIHRDDQVFEDVAERVEDGTIYGADGFWPERILRVEEASMGTNRFVRVECIPWQYNPVRRVLRTYTRVEAALVLEEE
jgi:hypothetical protein